MQVKVKNIEQVYDGFFKIVEAEIEHSRFDGSTQTIKRLCFERGDAVAAVVFDHETRELLLTEQFRYPAYARSGDSTTLELIAGMLNPGEDKDECIAREMQEELGYAIERKVYLGCYFLSPGGSSERVHLYYVVLGERIDDGGGRLDENEDIRVRRFSVSDLSKLPEIKDAKTALGLQLSREFWVNGY